MLPVPDLRTAMNLPKRSGGFETFCMWLGLGLGLGLRLGLELGLGSGLGLDDGEGGRGRKWGRLQENRGFCRIKMRHESRTGNKIRGR